MHRGKRLTWWNCIQTDSANINYLWAVPMRSWSSAKLAEHQGGYDTLSLQHVNVYHFVATAATPSYTQRRAEKQLEWFPRRFSVILQLFPSPLLRKLSSQLVALCAHLILAETSHSDGPLGFLHIRIRTSLLGDCGQRVDSHPLLGQ